MRAAAPTLSVVIPAYNEEARLGRSLRTVVDYLNQYASSELIVVDDGSTDDTAGLAERTLKRAGRVSLRVLRYSRNRGKGYAVRLGLLSARGTVGLFTDADLSTPVTEIPVLVDPITRGECDLTLGSRAVDRTLIGIRQPWLRETGGRIFNLFIRSATGLQFCDTQCGCKAFRMRVCRPLLEAATVDRFGFDVEWLYIAQKAGLRVREIPVRWDHCDGSKVSVRRDSLRMIQEVSAIRRAAAKGVYDQAIGIMRMTSHDDVLESTPRTLAPKAIA